MSAWGVAVLAGIQVRQHWTLNFGTWHLVLSRAEGEVSFLKVECWSLWILRVEYGKDVRRWRAWDQKAKNSWEKKEGVRLWRRSTRGDDQQRSEILRMVKMEFVRRWIMRMTWKYSYKEESMDCWMTSIELSALRSRERPKRIHATFNLIVTSSFLIVITSVNCAYHRSDIKKFLSRWNEACQRMLRWNPVGTEWSIGLLRRGLKKTINEFQTLLVAIFSSVICIFNCIYKYKQTGSTSLDDCFDAFIHWRIQSPESVTLNKLWSLSCVIHVWHL